LQVEHPKYKKKSRQKINDMWAVNREIVQRSLEECFELFFSTDFAFFCFASSMVFLDLLKRHLYFEARFKNAEKM